MTTPRAAVLCTLLLVAFFAGGCRGGSRVTHDRTMLLECLQRTNSTTIARFPSAIAVSFLSPDSVSAIETVAAGFGDTALQAAVDARAPTHLGVTTPDWTKHSGDVEVWGIGPYEPPIARRQGVSPPAAREAARALDKQVRASVARCLSDSER